MTTFIPYTNLTEKQKARADKRWVGDLSGYEFALGKKGEFLSRRKATGQPAPEAEETPAAPVEPAPVEAATVVAVEADVVNMIATALDVAPAELSAEVPAGRLSGDAFNLYIDSDSGRVVSQSSGLQRVPLVLMDDSPTQPRTNYDQAKHEELVASMREHGWIEAHPALLRPKPGPGAITFPVDPNAPEGQWELRHPETNEPLTGTRGTQAEVEELAAGMFARRFEVVFAHRRKRAAMAAGLTSAPAVIREMTDREVLEHQFLENDPDKRNALSPVDEARHLSRMLALRDPDGQPAYTRASLARSIGKAQSHIKQALSLLSLGSFGQSALVAGSLALSIAYEVAVIPDADNRERAAREIVNPTEGEAPMRFRAAQDFIRREFTRNLRDAKFPTDDPDLVPERRMIAGDGESDAGDGTVRYMGGACLGCRFNSATASEEKFARKLGVCGNVACFEAKVAADFQRWQAKHTDEAKGRVAVTPERNAELFDDEGELDWETGLVALDSAPDAGTLREPGAAGEATWRELTKGRLTEVLVARHPSTGKKVEVIDLEKAKAAAETNEHRIFKTSKARRQNDDQARDTTLATKREQEIARRVEAQLLGEVAFKAAQHGHLPPGALLALIHWLSDAIDEKGLAKVFARRKASGAEFTALAEGLDVGGRVGLIAELVLADCYAFAADDSASDWLEEFGVSVEDVARSVRLVVEAEEATAAKLAEPTWPEFPDDPELPRDNGGLWRALAWKSGEVANVCNWSADGVCENPDVIAFAFGGDDKAPEISVRLYAGAVSLSDRSRWASGFEIQGKQWSASAPLVAGGLLTMGRFGALAAAARLVVARVNTEERVSGAARASVLTVADSLDDLANAEAFALEKAAEEVRAAGDPEPKYLAYLTLHALRLGNVEPVVKTYDAADWLECLNAPAVVWVCALAYVETVEGAVFAAKEALCEAQGLVTAAGQREGFVFEVGENGRPAPKLGGAAE